MTHIRLDVECCFTETYSGHGHWWEGYWHHHRQAWWYFHWFLDYLFFMFTAAYLFIPHSRPIPLNITFNLRVATFSAAFCSDLWYVLKSSKNNRCVIHWLGAWDRLYPSMLLKFHTMGFSARVNNLSHIELPWEIPLFTLIMDRSSLYPRSYLPAMRFSMSSWQI